MSRSVANGTSYEVFEATMERLEQALSVGQIATFDFTSCDIDADPKEVLDQYLDYDQIPVQKDGKVVGVFERHEQPRGPTVRESMRPLDVSMLVAAEEPVSRFIDSLLKEPYYRLVLQGQHLNGIVTRSDLLKLPVRLLAFARVTYLELILAELINSTYPNGSWWSQVPNSRQKQIRHWQKKLQGERVDLHLLELTGLEDKYKLVSKIPGFADSFLSNMKEIKQLRNDLAHSKDFVADELALKQFLERLQWADYWIGELSDRIAIINSTE